MQLQQIHFEDRLLLCADCQGEFIFTAGEQLFFHDKQFKNDPKRCKPCKSRRSGLSAAANGAGPVSVGLSRTETRTECSACGIQTTVPFKPTQGRPVLCRQCFQSKNTALQANMQLATTLAGLSTESDGLHLSPEAAVLASASLEGARADSSVANRAELTQALRVDYEATQMELSPVGR